ncbi:MAG: hypothetical protein M0Q88_03105 [Bacilli bacterium]|nr:hypothetical protein [Bacilli bacterium]
MEKEIFKCERCGNKINKGSFDGIHDCVDANGTHYDYCFVCWSDYTTDTEEITNLIIS